MRRDLRPTQAPRSLRRAVLAFVLVAGAGGPLLLSGVTLPHTFSNGAVADAAQMNENLDALGNAIDAVPTSPALLTRLVRAGAVPNALANGSFEVTRATGGNASPAALWWTKNSLTTLVSETTPALVRHGATSLRAAGPTTAFIYQAVEDFADFRGETMTFSIDVLAGADGASIEVDDGIATTPLTVTSSASFQRVTVVHTVAANATRLAVKLFPRVAGSTFDSAMLVVGQAPTGVPFRSPGIADEEFRAARWFEQGTLSVFANDAYDDSRPGTGGTVNFRVQKAKDPTMAFGTVRYSCVDYWAGGGSITGSGAAASLLTMSPVTCVRTGCILGTEITGTIQAKECVLAVDWTATVAETTY